MEASCVSLPSTSDLSPSLLRFLSDQFRTADDLSHSGDLEADLEARCSDLELSLADLSRRFSDRIGSYGAHSDRIGNLLGGIRAGLVDLRDGISSPFPAGGGEQILARELSALAKEVARVETVRAYAETALKLDSLIGDVEDAVSSTMTARLKLSPSSGSLQEIRQVAISFLKNIEDILFSVAESRPQWAHLISAVDNRVDRALAVLRPQAIADHRSLLASLGWPPPLSSFIGSRAGATGAPLNPLITMEGDLKNRYFESFLALCNLQKFQRQRKSRQLKGHNIEVSLRQPLWAIEELVIPISLASQHHFLKWMEKPEFIFALVYKITRDFVDSMDEILQPLVDRARLAGYSCREEWIAAIMTSLCTYLAKELFPAYISQLEEESSFGVPLRARISWLSLIDSMIAFDKKIQSLITNSGLLIAVNEEENMQRISVLSVFCDRPDWLDIWAEMELHDTLDKLKPEMTSENNWKTRIDGTSLLCGSEDYKSPAISSFVIQSLSNLVTRSRSLPTVTLRSRFLNLSGSPLVCEFLDAILLRCQEAEGLTALADDDALAKVCNSINAARYCESVLMEWCEDVFFLEMVTISGDNANGGGSVFQDEISKLQDFHKGWLEKITAVILRGFDSRCREYLKNKKQWQEKEDGWTVSKSFVGALDYLQDKISKQKCDLNELDFVGLWRSLADGVDQLILGSILSNNVKFYDGGVERFGGDLEVLFGVFGAWCLRPEGFFPRLSEGLKLLRMGERELKEHLRNGKKKWLREKGVRHLSLAEAEKIAKNRIFT